jgi:hypothetical protein
MEVDEREMENRHFSKADRADARTVAEVGMNILF